MKNPGRAGRGGVIVSSIAPPLPLALLLVVVYPLPEVTCDKSTPPPEPPSPGPEEGGREQKGRQRRENKRIRGGDGGVPCARARGSLGVGVGTERYCE